MPIKKRNFKSWILNENESQKSWNEIVLFLTFEKVFSHLEVISLSISLSLSPSPSLYLSLSPLSIFLSLLKHFCDAWTLVDKKQPYPF